MGQINCHCQASSSQELAVGHPDKTQPKPAAKPTSAITGTHNNSIDKNYVNGKDSITVGQYQSGKQLLIISSSIVPPVPPIPAIGHRRAKSRVNSIISPRQIAQLNGKNQSSCDFKLSQMNKIERRHSRTDSALKSIQNRSILGEKTGNINMEKSNYLNKINAKPNSRQKKGFEAISVYNMHNGSKTMGRGQSKQANCQKMQNMGDNKYWRQIANKYQLQQQKMLKKISPMKKQVRGIENYKVSIVYNKVVYEAEPQNTNNSEFVVQCQVTPKNISKGLAIKAQKQHQMFSISMYRDNGQLFIKDNGVGLGIFRYYPYSSIIHIPIPANPHDIVLDCAVGQFMMICPLNAYDTRASPTIKCTQISRQASKYKQPQGRFSRSLPSLLMDANIPLKYGDMALSVQQMDAPALTSNLSAPTSSMASNISGNSNSHISSQGSGITRSWTFPQCPLPRQVGDKICLHVQQQPSSSQTATTKCILIKVLSQQGIYKHISQYQPIQSGTIYRMGSKLYRFAIDTHASTQSTHNYIKYQHADIAQQEAQSKQFKTTYRFVQL